MYSDGYVAPNVSVDGLVFQVIDSQLMVLLIKRKKEPFKDQRALPGGYIPTGETTLDALTRVLKAKAGVNIKDFGLVEQLFTFDTVARDPRGHAIDVTYTCLGNGVQINNKKELENPAFFPVDKLPKLAFDHEEIINYARQRLMRKTLHTNAVFALLPSLFTLTQLQAVYESIHGRKFDKRNFRKRFLKLDLIHETNKTFIKGAHRPAKLYGFNKHKLEELNKSFD